MRTTLVACTLCLLTLAAHAQQQVTLKTGPTLIGDVKFDGDAVLINIDGAETRIPFADIATVAPTDYSERGEAQRMLLRALESRLAGNSPKEAVANLAEASKLDPENPHIAFWLATNLVEAGYGKIARTKFEALREAIEEAYPDRASQLARAIERRVTIESLPADLVERIDEFNAIAVLRAKGAVDPDNPGRQRLAAVFRVLDQFNDPVDQSAVQVQNIGGQEQLEQFPDGYFFYSTVTGGNNRVQQGQLIVSQYGLKHLQQPINVRADEVAMGREAVVQRFAENDKRPVRIAVAQRDGKPLEGARVTLNPSNQQGHNPASFAAVTDAEGRASFNAFPGPYAFSVQSDGYNPLHSHLNVAVEDVAGPERRVVLHRAVTGTVRLEWRAKAWQAGGEATTGTTTLTAALLEAGGYYSNNVASAFRLGQVDDKLVLQIVQMNYGPMPPGVGAPIKRLDLADVPAEDRERVAANRFEDLDLAEFDRLGDEFKPAELVAGGPNFGGNASRIRVRPGDVIVGRTSAHDPQRGQPLEVTFKAIVESVDGANASTEVEDPPRAAPPPFGAAPPRILAPIAPVADPPRP